MTIERIGGSRQHSPATPAPGGSARNDEFEDLRDFFENAPISLHWVDGDGIIVRANRTELEFLGYTEDEYIGRPIADFHADRDVVEDLLGRLARNEVVHDYEARLRRKDGSIRHVLIDSSVLWRDGNFVHTRCFTRDNTEHKRLEQRLRDSEAQYQDFYEHAPDMFTSVDAQTGRYVAVNETFARATGYTREELIGRPLMDLYHPDARDAVREAFARFVATGELRDVQLKLLRKDGSSIPVSLSATAIRDADGKVRYSRSMLRDMSERTRTLAEKEQALALLDTLLAAAPVGFVVVDRDRRFVLVNQAASENNGISIEGHIGQRIDELFTNVEAQLSSIQHVFDSGEMIRDIEVYGETPSQPGVDRCWLVSYYPVRDGDYVSAVGVVFQDITQRKRAEDILSRQASLLDLAHDAIIVRELHSGHIVYWNNGAERTYGWSRDETLGKSTHAFLHTEHELGYEVVEKVMERDGSWDGELSHMTKDGERITVESRQVVFKEGAIPLVLETNRDITGRKYADDALRFSEERYRTLADAIPAMVTLTTPEGKVEYVSQSLLDYTGLTQEEAQAGDWTRILHPDDLAAHADEWIAQIARGETLTGEVRIRRHDGSYRWHFGRIAPVRDAAGNVRLHVGAHIDIDDRKQAEEQYRSVVEAMPAMVSTTTPEGIVTFHNQRWLTYTGRTRDEMLHGNWAAIVHPDDMQPLTDGWARALADGTPMETEYRALRHDGAYRWIRSFTVPVRGPGGAITMWIDAALDIDDRKQAEEELKRTADELERANAAKDEFLGLVSHELKTPITTIYGNAQVLRNRGAQLDAESRQSALDDVVHESERLHRIIDNLLVLARLEQGQEIESEPLLVRRIATRMADEHRQHHPYRQIRLSVIDDATPVSGQPLYLEQVIRNLLSNAEKYSPPNEPIDLDISRDGDSLCFSVLDRGRGFSEDEAGKIFTPFYRSAFAVSRASGVGIGLAVCKRLIEAQGGEMWAHPREGGGADIGFSLPLAEGASDD